MNVPGLPAPSQPRTPLLVACVGFPLLMTSLCGHKLVNEHDLSVPNSPILGTGALPFLCSPKPREPRQAPSPLPGLLAAAAFILLKGRGLSYERDCAQTAPAFLIALC